jgi:Glutathione S-transferase, N-terminal domain
MVVYLHSAALSPNGQRVAVVLIEKKIPFKLVAAQNIKSEEYLTIHPVCHSNPLSLPLLMAFIVWPNAPYPRRGRDPF